MEAKKTAIAELDGTWFAEVRRRILNWGPEHFQPYPWRRRLPFWQGLVVEVLLQRTRAAQVAPVFEDLIRRYPTATAFGNATEREIGVLTEPLGLRWRVPLLARLAKEVGDRRGRLSRDVNALLELPGVGPYAAGAALSLHGDLRALVADSNTVRLLCRLIGVTYGPETRRAEWVRVLLDKLVPQLQHRTFNYGLLDLAMTVCRPRVPQCADCPLATMCRWAESERGCGRVREAENERD